MTIDAGELLMPLAEEVERHGHKPEHIRFDFSSEETEDFIFIQSKLPKNSPDEIRSALKAAISNDYLAHAYMGQPLVLKLTNRGFYAGKSKKQSISEQQSRGLLRKISDWIERHNGLATLYAVIASTVGLILSILEQMYGKP